MNWQSIENLDDLPNVPLLVAAPRRTDGWDMWVHWPPRALGLREKMLVGVTHYAVISDPESNKATPEDDLARTR